MLKKKILAKQSVNLIINLDMWKIMITKINGEK